MKTLRKVALYAVLICQFESAISQSANLEAEPWMKTPNKNWPQILLTNKALFKGHSDLGCASGFLIKTATGVLACTAKHVIEEAGGCTNPPIDAKNLNKVLMSWKMFPRAVVKDTVTLERLLNPGTSRDILLFTVKSANKKVFALSPSLEEPVADQKLFMIGCEYRDKACNQRVYQGRFLHLNEGQWVMTGPKSVDLTGFSGAPVLNEKGHVIGLVSAGGDIDGDVLIWIEPLQPVENYLLKKN